MTLAELQHLLTVHDHGVLKYGGHDGDDGNFCALEFRSIVQGKGFTDDPHQVDFPDIRLINDAFGSDDAARTLHVLPVMATLWDWDKWSSARQIAWMQKVSVLTVQRIIAELSHLPDAIIADCQKAQTPEDAAKAAKAAKAAEAAKAAKAAKAARAARVASAAWEAGAAEAVEAVEAAAWAAGAAAEAAGAAAEAAAWAAAWAAAEAAGAVETAEAAAGAAAEAAADAAAWAAAEAAAGAARASASQKPLEIACALWIEAARDTEGR